MNEEIERSQAYLRIIDTGVGYDSAFWTLCTIVNTWDDVDSIHVRECLKDTLSDGKYDLIAFAGDEELFMVDNLQELVDMTLPIVMVKAASDPAVSDLVLEHMIKDATDHHIKLPHDAVALEYYNNADDDLTHNLSTWIADGQSRLAPLYQSFQWDCCLSSWKTNHTMHWFIDHWFDYYYYY